MDLKHTLSVALIVSALAFTGCAADTETQQVTLDEVGPIEASASNALAQAISATPYSEELMFNEHLHLDMFLERYVKVVGNSTRFDIAKALAHPQDRSVLSEYIAVIARLSETRNLTDVHTYAAVANLHNAAVLNTMMEKTLANSTYTPKDLENISVRFSGQSYLVPELRSLLPTTETTPYLLIDGTLEAPEIPLTAYIPELFEQQVARAKNRFVTHPRAAKLSTDKQTVYLPDFYMEYAEYFPEDMTQYLLDTLTNTEVLEALRNGASIQYHHNQTPSTT